MITNIPIRVTIHYNIIYAFKKYARIPFELLYIIIYTLKKYARLDNLQYAASAEGTLQTD